MSQAKAGPSFFAERDTALTDLLKVCRRDPFAGVCDRKHYALTIGSERNLDYPTLRN